MDADTGKDPRTTFADRVRGGGRTLFGTWVKIPAVEVVELLALAGFDYIVIDLEHSAMTVRDASNLIAVANVAGLAALVRVPDHAPGMIGRVLDCGAAGVIVPQVDTVAAAAGVVGACRFPPAGRRGAGATTRAGGWGLDTVDSYLARGNSALVVVQLESTAAMTAAAEIAAVAGVDAVLFGPQDLALSSGMGAHDVADAIRSVEGRLAAGGVPLGIAVGLDVSDAREYARRGYRLVLASNDASILGSGARSLVQGLRRTDPSGADTR